MKPLQVLPWGVHSRLALGAYQHGPKPVALAQEAIELWRKPLHQLLRTQEHPETEGMPEGVQLAYMPRPLPSLSGTLPFSGIRKRLAAQRQQEKKDEQEKRAAEKEGKAREQQAREQQKRQASEVRQVQAQRGGLPVLLRKAADLRRILRANQPHEAAHRKALDQARKPLGGASAQGLNADAYISSIKGSALREDETVPGERASAEAAQRALESIKALSLKVQDGDSGIGEAGRDAGVDTAELWQNVKQALGSGLDSGVTANANPLIKQLTQEIREQGWQPHHDDMLYALTQERLSLKSGGDDKAELDYYKKQLLAALENERHAHDAREEFEKSGKTKTRVNEMTDGDWQEDSFAEPDNNFQPYLKQGIGYQEEVACLMVHDNDPGGAGQCQCCGMFVPSHLDDHVDSLTGNTVRLCPMCNATEHLDWAGLHQSGRMVWAPGIPQAFFTQVVTLCILAVSHLRDADELEAIEEVLGDPNFPGLLPDKASLLQALELQGVPEDRLEEVLQAKLKRKQQLRRRLQCDEEDTGRPDLKSLSEHIGNLYDRLEELSQPLRDLLGGQDGVLDVSDPLFYAEQLRAEGFSPEEVRLLRKKHDAILEKQAAHERDMEGKAASERTALEWTSEEKQTLQSVGSLVTALQGIEGLRYLPDPAWWAPLVLGPWRKQLEEDLPPARWRDFIPEMPALARNVHK